MVEAVDEYCIQSLPEFEGKKFQNAAKEGLKLDESEKSKQRKEALDKEFEPLLTWMKDDALKDQVRPMLALIAFRMCYALVFNMAVTAAYWR